MSFTSKAVSLQNFIFNGLLLEDTFEKLEQQGISVRGNNRIDVVCRIEETDFSPRILHEARTMSSIFVAFFCMENSVRELIIDRLAERHGIDWWEKCVPAKVQKAVLDLKRKEEVNRYHTARSTTLIGYTMFGNLAQIITNNWDDFSDLIPDQAWLASRFNDLEMSRNVIMHTGFLPQIEIDRIESIVRDWKRQVG